MSGRLQAGIVLALVFAAGIVVGWGLTTRSDRATMRPTFPRENVSVYEPLGLRPGQRDRLDSILRRASPGTDRMMDSVQLRLRAHFDSIEQAIRAVLDADQLRRLDSLRAVGGLAEPGVRMRRPGPPGQS
jgi:hypothetical protein